MDGTRGPAAAQLGFLFAALFRGATAIGYEPSSHEDGGQSGASAHEQGGLRWCAGVGKVRSDLGEYDDRSDSASQPEEVKHYACPLDTVQMAIVGFG